MKKNKKGRKGTVTRRSFLKTSAVTATGAAMTGPMVVPSSIFGANAPSNRITLGIIGCGRIARTMDIPEFLKLDGAQIVAVCDVDSKRVGDAKKQVEEYYAKKNGKGDYKGCTTYGDYLDLVERKDIDAVAVCTPDHWHTLPAVAAARRGKDIFIQKPLTLTINEGRFLSDTVYRHGRVLQVGSQQRSERNFRFACELVRNGRIGRLHTVRVGLPGDPGCGEEPEMLVPKNLNYEMWVGRTPEALYTEKRVHPNKDYSRPGWLRIEAYGAGMITGWGAHHNDIAHWGMGCEYTGPVELEGEAQFPESGLWDVHGDFKVVSKYANGVTVIAGDNKRNKQGVHFEGSEGWVYVKRGLIDAEPKSLLTSEIGPDEIHLYKSDHHKQNFLDCIRSRALTVAPVEIAHRSCTKCLLDHIAMKLKRKLKWNPEKERFIGDDEANSMLSRPMRKRYTFERV